MLENDSRPDPRVKRTYQLLQNALVGLMREKDFQKITVQDIAERAELNRATFYAHFEDKYALLNHIVRDTFQERLDEKLSSKAPAFTLDNLRILTLTVCDYQGEFLGHCAPPSSSQHDQAQIIRQTQKNIHDVVLEWVAKSPRQHEVPPEVVATVTSWAIFGAVLQWVQGGRKLPAERLTEQVVATLTAGLQPYLVKPEAVSGNGRSSKGNKIG